MDTIIFFCYIPGCEGERWLTIATAIMNGLFLASTSVSGSSSLHLHRNLCLPGIALYSFNVEKGGAPGWTSLVHVLL